MEIPWHGKTHITNFHGMEKICARRGLAEWRNGCILESMNYWLMKSEPSVYSIDDLARDGRTPWTGVRNYQARNFMRDQMREGDGVFFYHSSAEPTGIAGLARVVGAPYPDPTQFDPKSEYFDPKATPDKPIWFLVDVEFVRKVEPILTLARIRAEPKLAGLALLKRGQRLSVQPVSAEHARILLKLIGAQDLDKPARGD